jgi:CRP-like cAMP-binding protein
VGKETQNAAWLKATLPEIRIELRSIPFFSDVLTPEELDDLATVFNPRVFPSGAIVMRQGEIGNSMLCLIEGTVQVALEATASKPSEIIRLRAGTVVGEMEVLSGRMRLATVTAIEDVRALEISRSALESALSRSPDLAESLNATLRRRGAIYSQAAARDLSFFQKLLSRFRFGPRR